MKARIWLPLVLALGILGAAGCGGGDDGEETVAPATEATTAALTKEELLTQGDAICAEVNAAVGTVSSTASAGAAQVAQEADLYGGMVERLKALGTPDEATGYEEFIGAADALAKAESDAALAAARGDSAGLQAAQSESSAALSSFQSAAQAYGFEDCGEEPSAPSTTTGAGSGSGEAEGGEGFEEAAPEGEVEEVTPETGGAGTAEEEAGGGAGTGGGTSGGGTESGSGGGSGGIGPG